MPTRTTLVVLSVLSVALWLTLFPGCGGPRSWKKIGNARPSSPSDMVVAVSSEDADARRKAVMRVATSPNSKSSWAVDGYKAMALLESDPQARCIAIRALGRSGDHTAADTLVRVLTWQQQPRGEVRPPEALPRADATRVLAVLTAGNEVSTEVRPKVEEVFLDRLKHDDDENVRLSAAMGLGQFATEAAVNGLIDALADQNFAVTYHCEDSLVRLTGHTNNCNPEKWHAWVAEHQAALFADKGQIPASRKPPGDIERFTRELRDRWSWFIPFDQ